MKSLLIIMGLMVVVPVGALEYMSATINSMLPKPQYVLNIAQTPQTAPETLTIDATDFNSAGDALQTVAGVNLYQDSVNFNN